MADFSCTFLGLKLKSPIIIECSTIELDDISTLANSGAGAIVLKPLIEEYLINDSDHISELIKNMESGNDIKGLLKMSRSGTYLDLIFQLKNKLNIPVIASIDCISTEPYIDFTNLIEYVGADAIQLSIFSFPDDKDFRSSDYEKTYCEIATKITYGVKIPVYIKMTPYFTNLLNTIDQLFYRGLQGIAIFDNYTFQDIDIHKFEFVDVENSILQHNQYFIIKWLGIISSVINKLDVVAYSNLSDSKELIKYILSGANAVIVNQKNILSENYINELLSGLNDWMIDNGFSNIEHFHGQMNYQDASNITMNERASYLKSKGLQIYF